MIANDTTEPTTIAVGTTYETAFWRAHRFADALHVTSLVHAGKRGKTCMRLVASRSSEELVRLVAAAVWAGVSEAAMGAILAGARREDVRAIDVVLKAIQIDAPGVRGLFSPREVRVTFTDDMPRPAGGTFKMDTNVRAAGPRDAAKAYRWAAQNPDRFAGMTLTAFRGEMSAIGVSLAE